MNPEFFLNPVSLSLSFVLKDWFKNKQKHWTQNLFRRGEKNKSPVTVFKYSMCYHMKEDIPRETSRMGRWNKGK